MKEKIIDCMVTAFAIGMVAFVYAVICTDGGQIFDTLYKCLQRTLPDKLFMPIIGCEKCVAGQMALWTIVFKLVKNWWTFHRAAGEPWFHFFPWVIHQLHPLTYLFTICMSIYFTVIFKKIYTWANPQK